MCLPVIGIAAFLTASFGSALITFGGEQPGSTEKWTASAAEAPSQIPTGPAPNGDWRADVRRLAAHLPEALPSQTPTTRVNEVLELCEKAARLADAGGATDQEGAAMLQTLRALQEEVTGQGQLV